MPLRVETIAPYTKEIYERVPMEIQILTLADDRIRKEDPDVRHKEYKRRQFMNALPILFPRQIYESRLR